MVELDLVGILLPVMASGIISLVVVLVLKHLNVADKTAKNSIVTTYSIGSIHEDMSEIKKAVADGKTHSDKRFDSLLELFEKRDEKNKVQLERIWQRIEEMSTKIQIDAYRLDRLEKGEGS